MAPTLRAQFFVCCSGLLFLAVISLVRGGGCGPRAPSHGREVSDLRRHLRYAEAELQSDHIKLNLTCYLCGCERHPPIMMLTWSTE
eukprot:352493-Chlamydomonas_euryale.AAC.2